jgi:clan AA aspartic protease
VIRGSVVGLQARVNVIFRIPGRPDVTLEFVVDTGFDGALTLPSIAAGALCLPFLEERSASLADGSHIPLDVYRATIVWDGQEVDVAVLATGPRPLLGTALIDGYNLNADFEDNGAVTITRV